MNENINNLYYIARQAKADDNSVSAAEYYNEILKINGTDWEAVFFATYFRERNQNIANIPVSAQRVGNILKTVMQLIAKNAESQDAQLAAVQEVCNHVYLMARIDVSAATNTYAKSIVAYQFIPQYVSCITNVTDLLYALGDSIEGCFVDVPAMNDHMVVAWKEAIALHCSISSYVFASTAIEQSQAIIDKYSEKVRKCDPTFETPVFKKQISMKDVQNKASSLFNKARGLFNKASNGENATKANTSDNNVTEGLKKLKELLDAGLISEEDFEAKKKQILGI